MPLKCSTELLGLIDATSNASGFCSLVCAQRLVTARTTARATTMRLISLVRCGTFDVLDQKNLDGISSELELQSELLSKRSEDRWAVRIDRFGVWRNRLKSRNRVWRVVQLDVEVSTQRR